LRKFVAYWEKEVRPFESLFPKANNTSELRHNPEHYKRGSLSQKIRHVEEEAGIADITY
jgi:hypothetical protein